MKRRDLIRELEQAGRVLHGMVQITTFTEIRRTTRKHLSLVITKFATVSAG